jgi:TP901 family phage tail tape measure protein
VAESIGSAVFDLTINDKAFQAGLAKANQSTVALTDSAGRLRDQFGRLVPQQKAAADELERFGKTAGNQGVFGSLGREIAGIAFQLGALGVAAKAFDQLKKADDASAALKTLGVNTVELGSNLQLVSAELKGNVSTLELTQAAYDVASSGFSKAADATQILRASAQGARGGFSDLNTVADAATSVLNAYGLSADQATKIIDGFITTQNDGKIVVDQYAQQIGKVAPIAAAAGVGIDELNAAISAATAQGVPVDATFSGLRQAISNILKPSKEASDLAAALGLNFSASALQAQGLGAFLQDVAAKTKGSAEANAVLFGSVEALTAVQPLLNDQLVKYNQFLGNQQNNAGAAAQASSVATQTINSGIQAIGNALSNLVTSSNFSSLGTSLAGVAETINNISLTPAQQELTGLQTAIDLVTAEIDRQKEYGLDTSLAEKKLADLESRARIVRSVISEQNKVEALKAEAIELGKQADALRRAGQNAKVLNPQLGAIGQEIAALQGKDISFNLPNGTQITGQLTGPLRELGAELDRADQKLSTLERQRSLQAPGIDTTKLDQEIVAAKQRVDSVQAQIKLQAESSAIDAEINRINGLLNDPVNFGRLNYIFGGPKAKQQLQDQLASLQQLKAQTEQINQANATAAKQQGAAVQQQVAGGQQLAAQGQQQLNVQGLLNSQKKQANEQEKTTAQLLDEQLRKRMEEKEALAASSSSQSQLTASLTDTAGQADAAAASAKALQQNLQGASTAKTNLADQFQAQVKVVLDGAQVFTTMNGYLKVIADNSAKPVPVNVTVQGGGGCGGGYSPNAAKRV